MRRKRASWKTKVHPAFIEIAGVFRALAEAQNQPAAKRAEAMKEVRVLSSKKRQELLERYPNFSPGSNWNQVRVAGYQPPSRQEKIAQVFDWFFFKRNRVPAMVALEKQRDGDLKSHKQVVRAMDEFWRLLNGHGPVPFFKVNQLHTDLLELGLHLRLGQLTAEELADCFDELCSCGKTHDPDALKKQRARVLKDLREAQHQGILYASRIPSQERFAAHGADELIARAYCPREGSRYVEITRAGVGLQYTVYEDSFFCYAEDSMSSPWRVFSDLPAAFFVGSLEELFKMFFPNPARPQMCA